MLRHSVVVIHYVLSPLTSYEAYYTVAFLKHFLFILMMEHLKVFIPFWILILIFRRSKKNWIQGVSINLRECLKNIKRNEETASVRLIILQLILFLYVIIDNRYSVLRRSGRSDIGRCPWSWIERNGRNHLKRTNHLCFLFSPYHFLHWNHTMEGRMKFLNI